MCHDGLMGNELWGDFRFSASLQVRHPKRDTSVFDTILRRRPERVWRAGNQRMAPKGAVLEGVYPESYGYYDLGKGRREDLAACLHKANRLLANRRRQVAAWRRSGGALLYYVSLFGGRGVVAEEFEPDLLAEIGGLGIVLGLEVLGAPAARRQP